MKSIIVLCFLSLLVTSCADHPASGSWFEQASTMSPDAGVPGIIAVCDPITDSDCRDDTGGTPGGGGTGTGGGGSLPPWQPLPNACYFVQDCDPTLGTIADYFCKAACPDLRARCYASNRCGSDCPEGHVGYCGVF